MLRGPPEIPVGGLGLKNAALTGSFVCVENAFYGLSELRRSPASLPSGIAKYAITIQ